MDHLKNVAWIHDGNRKPLFLIGWQVSFKSVHRDKTNKVSTFTVRVLLPITFLWINRMFPWHLTRAAHFTSPTINIHNNLIRGLNSLADVFLKLVPASGLQSPPPPHTHTLTVHQHRCFDLLSEQTALYWLLSLSLSFYPLSFRCTRQSTFQHTELFSLYLLYPPFCTTPYEPSSNSFHHGDRKTPAGACLDLETSPLTRQPLVERIMKAVTQESLAPGEDFTIFWGG